MNFKIFLTILSLIFFSTASYAEPNPKITMTASEFVISLMKDANTLSELPKDQQQEALLKLVNRGFNIPLVARFVMGRYWRKATVLQRHEFLEVFEHAAVRTFSPLLGDVPLDKFKINRVTFTLNDDTSRIEAMVYSTLIIDNDTIKIRWMLRNYGDGYQAIDITAEGISLVVTLRSEYTTYIKNHSIEGLIDKLRGKGTQ